MPFSSSRCPSKIYFFILLFFSLFIISCSSSGRFTREIKKDPGSPFDRAPQVKILLNEPSSQLSFDAECSFTVYNDRDNPVRVRKGDHLNFRGGNVIILSAGGEAYRGRSYSIKPDGNFLFRKVSFSGDIRIVSDGRQVYLLNTVNLENYIKGVIPAEMPLGRGDEYFEGLKAFAICARTFTLRKLSGGEKIFDVRTDVRDQVYGGTARQREISDKAADETRGMILTYNDEPASVFYSSNCGGRTEEVENVFGSERIPYLTGIEDGDPPFCNVSPQAQWTEKFTGERIVNLLIKGGKLKKGEYEFYDITVNSRFRSGRINELEILVMGKSGKEQSVKLSGNNIRFVLLTSSNQVLNSNNFEIVNNGKGEIIIRGRGWGHGVGLCQWGALSRSASGITFQEILDHYFPGTAITRYYD